MTGREKCSLLRQIRTEIARANGIPYTPEKCTYEGNDCVGTCPKCEEDLAYLNAALNQKIVSGEPYSFTGVYSDAITQTAEPSPSVSGEPSCTMGELSEATDDLPLSLTIDEIDLSVRAFNFLKRAGINTVSDIITLRKEELFQICHESPRFFDEIIREIKELGLALRDSEDDDTSIRP